MNYLNSCHIVSAVALISLAAPARADDVRYFEYPRSGAELNCQIGFDPLKTEILAIQDIEPNSSNNEFESFAAPSSSSVYTFTKPGHYAHPMIIKRTVLQESGAVVISTSACGFNSKRKSDRLMKEFQILNQQLSGDFRGKD